MTSVGQTAGGAAAAPVVVRTADACVDAIIERVGKRLVVGLPLGLGKPLTLMNALYARAKADRSFHLTFLGALHLEKPVPRGELERRFLGPFSQRMWGAIPDFQHRVDLRRNALPPNVEVVEFYFRAGAGLGIPLLQENYVSCNYTHAVRDARANGLNVLAQIVAPRETDGRTVFSMSCNSDTHHTAGKVLHEVRRTEPGSPPTAIVCEINRNLPFMYGHSCVTPDFYDVVLDDPDHSYPLFAAPKEAVSTADFMVGLYSSAIVADGGTLQIGIGSLGDAMVHGLTMRQEHNDDYRRILDTIGAQRRDGGAIDELGGLAPFREGLLGSSEMFVDGFMHLMRAGIIKRRVYENAHLQRLLNQGKIQEQFGPDILEVLAAHGAIHRQMTEEEFATLRQFGILRDDVTYADGALRRGGETFGADLGDGTSLARIKGQCLGTALKDGISMYGSFFLGPDEFYEYLRNLPEEERRAIRMEGVEFVNQLYGDQELKTLQRRKGRFVNAGLMVTVVGDVISDGLENNVVISGPGGQYNFISMAHELPGARSAVMLRSTRSTPEATTSNIVWQYAACTIPRHLRDIVVTEYGIADIRSRRDKDVVASLINIADSRFQRELVRLAQRHNKLPKDHVIPDRFRQNVPERLDAELKPHRERGLFPAFPFGCSLTPDELVLGKALRTLKEKAATDRLAVAVAFLKAAAGGVPARARPYLERMGLDRPAGAREKVMQKTVLAALVLTKAI